MTTKFVSSDEPRAKKVSMGFNTSMSDIMGRTGEPDEVGYVRAIYRRPDGTFFQVGEPMKRTRGHYCSSLVNMSKESALKMLCDWGLLKSLKLFFGDDPDAQGYISRLEGRPARPAAVGGLPGKAPEKARLGGESPLVRDALRRKAESHPSEEGEDQEEKAADDEEPKDKDEEDEEDLEGQEEEAAGKSDENALIRSAKRRNLRP